jgi:outer membrane biosynthesis protein TonB
MATKLDSKNSFEEFLQTPKIDRHFRLSISRNTLVAFIVSLLIHTLILFFVMPKFKQAPEVEPPPFEIVLAQPEQAETPPVPLPEILPQEPIPEPPAAPVKKAEPIKKPKVMTKPKTKTSKPSDFSVPDVLATPKPAPDSVPAKPDDRPTDMLAYVNKKRSERDAEEASAAKINAEAVAKEKGPSEEEKRDAKIKSNFQNGANGIFEITSLSNSSATFTFLGWVGDFSASHRQYFEVEAGRGEDVRRVMIRRMISLIREHYQGDFNWESHRMGRTIVLSARQEDSSGLEDFLMQEFFGQNYQTAL